MGLQMSRLAMPVALILLSLAGSTLTGCNSDWKPIEYFDPGGSNTCLVEIESGGYDKNDSPPVVEIIWDSRILFSGKLPAIKSSESGMPITLFYIHTNQGPHALLVKSGNDSQQVDLDLKDGQRKSFLLFDGYSGSKELVEDITGKPWM
jgi:hypothetical protein